jgi:1,4-dihydroxy-2-naphthoate octaprenyltransferase
MQQTMKVIVALWGMARPLIMLSVILVYGAGGLIARAAEYQLNVQALGWGLAALLFVALSIHYVNEYADYETDALTRRTPFSGGSGVLPSGDVPRILALQAGWLTLILGVIIAMMGIFTGILTTNTLIVLLIGAFGGWMYSLPPLKLAWRGWGEVDNALLGGLVLPLYGYTVQTGRIDGWVMVACLPFTLLVFINLLATTWADREADGHAGKCTLATRLPLPALRLIYGASALLCFMLLILLADQTLPQSVAISGFVALPLVVWGGLRYTRIHSPHPTVFAMIAFLLAQMLLWFWAGS